MLNYLKIFRKSIHEDKLVSYSEPIENWDLATSLSEGYGKNDILNRLISAYNSIFSGDYACEQDTVLSKEYIHSKPLHVGLLISKYSNKKSLNILDYGGSFASSYFRNYDILKYMDINWYVYDYEKLVEKGKQIVKYPNIHFCKYDELLSVKKDSFYDVILLGSSLQFFENTNAVISELLNFNPKVIIIEQTPCTEVYDSFLTVQKVKEPIYNSSYPAWHFNLDTLINLFLNYKLVYKKINYNIENTCGDKLSYHTDLVLLKK